jgi:hypothetical protein
MVLQHPFRIAVMEKNQEIQSLEKAAQLTIRTKAPRLRAANVPLGLSRSRTATEALPGGIALGPRLGVRYAAKQRFPSPLHPRAPVSRDSAPRLAAPRQE